MRNDEFGRIFDLNRGTIGSYIDEKSQPKIATLQKISEYFDITIDELISNDLEKTTITQSIVGNRNIQTGNNNIVASDINSSGNTIPHSTHNTSNINYLQQIIYEKDERIREKDAHITDLREIIREQSETIKFLKNQPDTGKSYVVAVEDVMCANAE
jgi:DNA-binding XRE family transcriptional regulator